jgi:hypothetical protein
MEKQEDSAEDEGEEEEGVDYSWKTNSLYPSYSHPCAPQIDMMMGQSQIHHLNTASDVYKMQAAQLEYAAQMLKMQAAMYEQEANSLQAGSEAMAMNGSVVDPSLLDPNFMMHMAMGGYPAPVISPPPGIHMEGTSPESVEQAETEEETERPGTTVTLRNIPNNYKRDMLLDLLNQEGFAGMYDFIYLPIDFKKKANLGYAFLNFVSLEKAEEFRVKFDKFDGWSLKSTKKAEVRWGRLQGYDAHIERYRNSPVMHEDIPPDQRPLIFKDGVEQVFPAPTKKIKAPWLKSRGSANHNASSSS